MDAPSFSELTDPVLYRWATGGQMQCLKNPLPTLAQATMFIVSPFVSAAPADLDKAVALRASEIKSSKPTYLAEVSDLHGDSVLDAIVLFDSAHLCGTGGCAMAIFKGGVSAAVLVRFDRLTDMPGLRSALMRLRCCIYSLMCIVRRHELPSFDHRQRTTRQPEESS